MLFWLMLSMCMLANFAGPVAENLEISKRSIWQRTWRRWEQFEPRHSCTAKANGQQLRDRSVEPEDWLGPLPTAFRFITLRIMPKELFQVEPNQIIVNEYLPGQGIAPHID